MIVGGPGSGKSTLARELGARTGLPVFHMDHIHWKPGWIARETAEKERMTREVHAREEWIFEGGFSQTYSERLARADALIWLDMPLSLRLWRVTRRAVTQYGRTRPDMAPDCPEQLSREMLDFYAFIWRTRHSGRRLVMDLIEEAKVGVDIRVLRSLREVRAFLDEFDA